MEPVLMHYGTPRHSGRYPWGSGENPYQHEGDFYSGYRKLKKEGLSEREIADLYGMKSVNELRRQVTLAKMEYKDAKYALYFQMREEGLSRAECAKRLNISNESTLRGWEKKKEEQKENTLKATMDVLRRNVDEKTYVDVGDGVASGMGITKNRLETAVQGLKNEGYELHNIHIQQVFNPSQYTTVAVLCKPGVTRKEVYNNTDKIGLVNEHFDDPNGITSRGMRPPESISSSKVKVVYAEDGGTNKDGLIEIRRGAKGLDLGNANYAQVRIAVDGTHYLKGVAVYSDDMPKGVDILFNTNKHKGTPMISEDGSCVLKPLKSDPNNPFGTSLKFDNEKGLAVQKGYLNIVNEQGDWQKWSKTLSSQFLSKQPTRLAKEQLTFAKQQREMELKEIMMLDNPTVRKHELLEFSEKCDTAAVHLKAASMPGQSNSLILPINSLKPTEIYAPNYPNGTEVVLIRHPHGGTFELPQLKVNNRNAEAKKVIGISNDAVGIHHSVAAQLSGADFDGDTVVVIPNNSKRIKTDKPFKALQEFDPKIYKLEDPEGKDAKKVMSEKNKGREMGVASNLITDMTLRNAPPEDIIKAVKYSMVVIDSAKHELDYKQAKKDFEINALKRKYQQRETEDGKEKYGGASTLISRSKSEVRVPKRANRVDIDKNTGEKIFYPTGETYVDRKGREQLSMGPKSTQMREAKDAFSLVSMANNGTGTTMERVYAQYANSMKALANQARKAAVNIDEPSKNPEAAKKYSKEVDSLMSQLAAAKAWSPKERNAQIFADHVYKAAKLENPNMTDDDKKKIKTQALATGRARLGGKKPKVTFSDKEWEAVQANAIAKTTLSELLRYADSDKVKERALPRKATVMTASKLSMAKARLRAGYSYREVAEQLGVPISTLQSAINA